MLITLGIIGIVAALTMPSLVAKYHEKQTVSRLKKVYSTLSNAYTLILDEHGSPDNWKLPNTMSNGTQDSSYEGTSMIREKFLPYLKVTKLFDQTDLIMPQRLLYLNGSVNSEMGTAISRASLILGDGSLITFSRRANDTGCLESRLIAGRTVPICGGISIYLNGFKQNIIGKDYFTFWITPDSIIPTGLQGDTEFSMCKRNGYGFGCTAWVIYNENMDYLHCDNLSWGGKTKCD